MAKKTRFHVKAAILELQTGVLTPPQKEKKNRPQYTAESALAQQAHELKQQPHRQRVLVSQIKIGTVVPRSAMLDAPATHS